MKRVELLIDEVRALTGNQRYVDSATTPSGVSQNVMVRSLKAAQAALYQAIEGTKKAVLEREIIVPIVPNQEFYSLPRDIYLQNINTMQWTYNGSDYNQGWIDLWAAIPKDRQFNQPGYPMAYMLQGDRFAMVPPVSTGTLRLTYTHRIPDLEKRSGQISDVTIVNGVVTAITLDPQESSFDSSYLNKLQSLCVCGKYGEVKTLNVLFDDVDEFTGFVDMLPFALSDGETIVVGDYVTAGNWTGNVSTLPDNCENYLIKHSTYLIRYENASNWTAEAKSDLAMTLQSVLESFRAPTTDIIEIPITCCDYLDLSGWG